MQLPCWSAEEEEDDDDDDDWAGCGTTKVRKSPLERMRITCSSSNKFYPSPNNSVWRKGAILTGGHVDQRVARRAVAPADTSAMMLMRRRVLHLLVLLASYVCVRGMNHHNRRGSIGGREKAVIGGGLLLTASSQRSLRRAL
jgi:hypothetical protein